MFGMRHHQGTCILCCTLPNTSVPMRCSFCLYEAWPPPSQTSESLDASSHAPFLVEAQLDHGKCHELLFYGAAASVATRNSSNSSPSLITTTPPGFIARRSC